MYRYAYKHIELFKQIPFSHFIANARFISNVVNNPETYGTYENIIKCYYFISEELWDYLNVKPLIQYDEEKGSFYFYDFIRKRKESAILKRHKPIKLFNGVFDKNGNNRHFKKYHGLVTKNKQGIKKEDVRILQNIFMTFAYKYDQDLKYYKRKEIEIPTEWAEHLYDILKQLLEKAVFFYKQRGSLTLAQEMISVLSNQFLFVYSSNLIRYGHNRQKIIRQIKEKKQFMFGEIKHDIEHYKEIKQNLKKQQNTR